MLRRVLASWSDVEDLVNVGAYAAGANVEFDVAVRMKPAIDTFVQQGIPELAGFSDTRRRLVELAAQINALRDQITSRAGGAKNGAQSGR
jgi:flagellum-specific ATP synthase